MIHLKKGFNFLLVSLFCSLSIQAFSIEKDSTKIGWNPSLNLKFSPLPLLDYTPAIQIAAEYKVFERHSLNLEYGYIFSIEERDFSGNKFRVGYRYYFPIHRDNRIFIGAQGMNKTINFNTTGYAWSPERTYQERYQFQIKNHTQAIYITSGFVFKIFDRMTFEINYGVGRRKLIISSAGLPDDVEPIINLQDNPFNNARLGRTDTPAVLANFKIGYLLFGEH